MGVHPRKLIDSSLTEALNSSSPIRKYIASKFNFRQSDVSAFMQTAKASTSVADEQDFLRVLDDSLAVIKKNQAKLRKISRRLRKDGYEAGYTQPLSQSCCFAFQESVEELQ